MTIKRSRVPIAHVVERQDRAALSWPWNGALARSSSSVAEGSAKSEADNAVATAGEPDPAHAALVKAHLVVVLQRVTGHDPSHWTAARRTVSHELRTADVRRMYLMMRDHRTERY